MFRTAAESPSTSPLLDRENQISHTESESKEFIKELISDMDNNKSKTIKN